MPSTKQKNKADPSRLQKFCNKKSAHQVPSVVLACSLEVESRLPDSNLYVAAGSSTSCIATLYEKLQAKKSNFKREHFRLAETVHDVTNLLKMFLLNLRRPLIIPEIVDRVIAQPDLASASFCPDQFIQDLPKPNRDTLLYLLLHLQRVADSSGRAGAHSAAAMAANFVPLLIGEYPPVRGSVKAQLFTEILTKLLDSKNNFLIKKFSRIEDLEQMVLKAPLTKGDRIKA